MEIYDNSIGSTKDSTYQLLSELFLSTNEYIENEFFNLEISYIDLDSQLVTLDIESLSIKRKIKLEFGELSFIYTSICNLPDNKLFCYGGKTFVPSGVSFIIDNFSDVIILQNGFPCYSSSSIYYHKSVYVFGGVKEGILKLCARYSLTSKKWFSLSPLPEAGKDFSLDILGRFILYSSPNTGLYIYDTFTNSHLKILDIWNKLKRLVLCGNSRGYLLQSNGDVYESEYGDVFNWNIVSYFSFSDSPFIGCKVKHKDCAYFICGETLFKFDMTKLKGIRVKFLPNIML